MSINPYIIGSLLYLSVATWPNILYAVSNVAKFSVNPTTRHWITVKRIMSYLKGMSHLGIIFKPQENCDCMGFLMQTGQVTLMTESLRLDMCSKLVVEP